MQLGEVAKKVEFSLAIVNNLKGDLPHSGHLWYHSIALMNAFYAIKEELKNNVGNKKNDPVAPLVKSWLNDNKESIESFFGADRNTATHQGAITVNRLSVWVEDQMNDTERPVSITKVSIKGSKVINDITADEFLGIAESAFHFYKEGIFEIQRSYHDQGGEGYLFDSFNNKPSAFCFNPYP